MAQSPQESPDFFFNTLPSIRFAFWAQKNKMNPRDTQEIVNLSCFLPFSPPNSCKTQKICIPLQQKKLIKQFISIKDFFITKNNSFMKKILFLMSFVIMLGACTKEEIVTSYITPTLYLDSCVVSNLCDAKAYITIDKGENFFNHKVQLLLYDADNPTEQTAAFDVKIDSERNQKIVAEFKLPETNKTYIARVVMKTDKNTFTSGSTIVFSSNMSKKEKFHYLHGTPKFYHLSSTSIYCTNGVGCIGTNGDNFHIEFKELAKKGEMQIKVGNQIVPITEEYGDGFIDNLTWKIWAKIPDMPAGIYDVSIVWQGEDIPLDEKMQILPYKVNMESCNSIKPTGGNLYVNTFSFRIDDKMYYFVPNAEMMSYDLKNNNWTRHNIVNIPNIVSVVALGNKAYAITSNYDFYKDVQKSDYLLEYDPATDKWKKLAVFPNNRNMWYMHLFAVGKDLYMCDGLEPETTISYNSKSKRISELWKYDMAKGEWKAMNDIPSKLGFKGEHRVEYYSGKSIGYAMDIANGQFWTYNPATDKWTYESLLETQIYGANTALMEYNDKIIFFGHGDNSAVYSYDFKTRSWDILSIYQWGLLSSSNLPMTIYDNRIIVGPYLTYSVVDDTLYFLTVDLK